MLLSSMFSHVFIVVLLGCASKKQQTKIIDLVSDAATPTVQKLGAEKLQPIMSAMFGEIEKAFVASVSSFHVKMNKRIDNDFEARTFNDNGIAGTFNDNVIKPAERYLD